MSSIRRVVTGHTATGKAVFASDVVVDGFEVPGMPGPEIHQLWGADEAMVYPDAGESKMYPTFFPPLEGFRFLRFTVPPDQGAENADTRDASPDGSGEARLEGLSDTFDAAIPGMHRSDTIDLLYVISGRCILELDDGIKTELGSGDTVVQSGTMHAWRNPYSEPCYIVAAVIGAKRK